MTTMLRQLFASHLVDDDRSAAHLFDIDGYRIGLLLPEAVFFLQVIAVRASVACLMK